MPHIRAQQERTKNSPNGREHLKPEFQLPQVLQEFQMHSIGTFISVLRFQGQTIPPQEPRAGRSIAQVEVG